LATDFASSFNIPLPFEPNTMTARKTSMQAMATTNVGLFQKGGLAVGTKKILKMNPAGG
jgi:hypothetical protein